MFSACRDSEFLCDGARCLPAEKVCNGWEECDDGTDEENCTGKQ